MRVLKALIALLFAVAGLLIGALNRQTVDIDLFFTRIQAHLGQQSLGGISAQVQGGHTRSGDPALPQPDRLGGTLQRGAVEARGESVRDEITQDRTRGHGDPGETDVGKGGMHEMGGLEDLRARGPDGV